MKTETRVPFYLAWKYLQRGNKWTLLLTVFLMAIAFINLVFISSLFNGIIDGTNQQIINTMTGNIYITPKDGSDNISNQKNILKTIKNTKGVESASPEIFVPASLEFNNHKGNWTVLSIDPNKEKNVTNVSQNMISGEYLNNSDTNSIIIGHQIAGGEGVEQDAFSLKGVKVGDKVTLSLNGLNKELIVKGIFTTKFLDTDSRAFITNKTLSKIIPTFSHNPNTIIVKTKNGIVESDVINRLKAGGIDENIYTWEEAAGFMSSVTKSFLSINILISFVGVLIAAVTIFIIIYVDIINKRREIGILRAIGIKPYIIFTSYIIKAAAYSVGGVLLGSAIFFGILVPYFNLHPFVLPICDAVLVLTKMDFIARAETIMWVAVLSALIPSVAVTRSKILIAIFGK